MINSSVLGAATVFYWLVERWSLLDSAYFVVVTAATIGYGDVVPQTSVGKLFTIGFVFVGVGLFVVLATSVASEFYRHVKEDPMIRDALEEVEAHIDGHNRET
ncbi:potassium channel family protein [Cognatishimia activa]|uniref:potassium channel family protein n=1 Tax=Cognatishimia activa TaxID=1715691 RepID=UPI00223107A2|nr:potassium channel family protein [Cognatishimia activa]UZD90318.1 potassium channel family protein [Cognatishimia activa]